MKPVYVHAVACLSPQHTFDNTLHTLPLRNYADNKLRAVDPDYSRFINPVAIRRMSRLLKMGIATGMKCVQNAGIDAPDAIITGTGRGSKLDMEIFLKDMIRLDEEALNPTYFIQSTYNSVNGWLALQTKCTGYNQTYVHRGFSLELALTDAQLLVQEKNEPGFNVLVGAFDELTDEYYLVKDKIGYWKKEKINSLELLEHTGSEGTIFGEGAAFIMLSSRKEGALFTIHKIACYYPNTFSYLGNCMEEFLEGTGFAAADIDLIVCGVNADARHQGIYDTLFAQLPDTINKLAFKPLCGDFDTSTGFAFWLINDIFANGINSDYQYFDKKNISPKTDNILIINNFNTEDVSICLVSRF